MFSWNLATQLARDVLPILDKKGVKLFMGSIGTKERGIEFCSKTDFPAERLLADPTGALYPPLDMNKGIAVTFFSRETPLAIWKDIQSGRIEDLKETMKKWTKNPLWIPPQQDQAFQQGGVAVFKGDTLVWIHRDKATGAHADLDEVIKVATQDL